MLKIIILVVFYSPVRINILFPKFVLTIFLREFRGAFTCKVNVNSGYFYFKKSVIALTLLARRATIVARASARTQAVIDRRYFAWFSKTKKNFKTNIILDQMVSSKDKKGDFSNEYAKRNALKSDWRRNSKFYAWGLLFDIL